MSMCLAALANERSYLCTEVQNIWNRTLFPPTQFLLLAWQQGLIVSFEDIQSRPQLSEVPYLKETPSD